MRRALPRSSVRPDFHWGEAVSNHSLVHTFALPRRFPYVFLCACAWASTCALNPIAASGQQPYPYYPPRGAPPPQAESPYQDDAAAYPETAYPYRGGQPDAASASPVSWRQHPPDATVRTSFSEGYDNSRPQAATYFTEIVRPLPPTNVYSNSQASGDLRLAQNVGGTEVIRPGTPAPVAEQSLGTPPLPEPENRFQGLLPAAGPPPQLGPVPSEQTEREYARFVDGSIIPENTIRVVVGRAVVLVTQIRPRRVYIPNEDFATTQIVTDQQIAIVGKKEGRTTLDLWFPDPREPNNPAKDRALSYLVVVVRDTLKDDLARWDASRRTEAEVEAYKAALKVLQSQIKETFPDSAVQLSMIGEQVVVRGEAKDIVEAAHILMIVAEHAPVSNRRRGVTNYAGGRNPNVNLNVGVGAGAEGAVQNAIQSFNPGLNLSLNAGPGQQQAALNAIQQILSGAPNIVNLLRIPGEQQVMLMVTVAEVNRTAARTIGMDFSIVHGNFAFAQNSGQGINVGNSSGIGAGNANSAIQTLQNVGGNLPTAIDSGNVLMAITALRTMNFARSLAEPNLVAMNGRPASTQIGGSFPIPTSVVTPGGAAQSVSYQNFGVALQFTPYITDRNRIRIQFNASVSTPSLATTQVSGAQVPSQISQRQFETTVEMREGQTLTVGGLIQNNFNGTSRRVPLWGDLPIVGRTGGLDNVTSGEQELVVLVTPVLVHPVDMCKTPPLPGNNVFEPGDVEFYIMGHLEGRRSEDFRAGVRTDFERQKKWCSCEDIFIIGPHGPSYGCCRPCLSANFDPAAQQVPQAVPQAVGAAPVPPESVPAPTPQ